MNPNPTHLQDAATQSPAEAPDGALDLICTALRNGPADKEKPWQRTSASAFLKLAEAHGVGPLLHRALRSSGAAGDWADEIRGALAESGQREAACEATRVEEIRRVLAALDAERVAPVMLESTALAYSVYPEPQLRPRESTHMLVRRAAVADVARILAELGYRRHHPPPGARVLHQDTYLRQDGPEPAHAVKLRWAIGNHPPLAGGFDCADIRRRAVAIEALSPCAMAPCHEDALLLACVRRCARARGAKLIGLYDIHLLVERMTPVEFERFARAALDMHMGQISRDAIAEARRRFHTALPSGGLEDHFAAEILEREARARLRISPRHRLRIFLAELGGLGRLREKLSSARGDDIPPPADTAEACSAKASPWLPALHLRRGLKGIGALLKRSQ